MKAAVVQNFSQAPRFSDFDEPQCHADEILIETRAAAISQLVRAKAAGKHYSSPQSLPLIAGTDGVGIQPDGQRVFFAFPRHPLGTMAERVAVNPALCIPVPDDVDDITAAAIGNPGMSSIAALEYRAHFQPGEAVLINGAAGASGRLAIKIARHMGAGRIIATARNPAVAEELLNLGADAFICLQQPDDLLAAAFSDAVHGQKVDIVLDYLWGTPAAILLQAISSGHAFHNPVRFVNIGQLAGADIALNAGILRSSNLILSGSGIGSVSMPDLMQSIGKTLQLVQPAGLKIATKSLPLEQVEAAWHFQGNERMVITV